MDTYGSQTRREQSLAPTPTGSSVSHEEVDSFEQDSWVRVEGVLGLEKVGDLVFPLIQAERITKIDPPKDPYLFPRLF